MDEVERRTSCRKDVHHCKLDHWQTLNTQLNLKLKISKQYAPIIQSLLVYPYRLFSHRIHPDTLLIRKRSSDN